MTKNIDLPTCCNITTVEKLHQEFIGALTQASDFELNISMVEKADTCGIQLLYAFQKAVTAKGGRVSIVGESDVFSSVMSMLGFHGLFSGSTE